MATIWKTVPGYSNYEVSNSGLIRNAKKGTILKQYSDGNYLQTSYSQEGSRTIRRVHLVVANAFVPNPKLLPFVNHIDGNKENNCASNLEWVSAKENADHYIKMGLRKHKRAFKGKSPLILEIERVVIV